MDLSETFVNELEEAFDYKEHVSLEVNKLRGYPKKNNTKYANRPSMQTYYYSRPTPQDVLIEERDWNQTNTSYSESEIYEWNLDGFTSQLRDWWDNYMTLEAKAAVKVDKLRERSQLGDFCTQFGLPDSAPNCKLEKLKALELDEEVHDKIYSFLYIFGSESDYDSDTEPEKEDNRSESSKPIANTKGCKCNREICSCEDDEFFYKLQSQFEHLNIQTITSENMIELLKEFTDNDLRDKIIQLAVNNNASSSKPVENVKKDFEFKYYAPYSLYVVNARLNNQLIVIRDASFDDLKGEIENFKNEIKSLKQHQMICDHRLTQIEKAYNKGKNIVEEDIPAVNTLANSFNSDPKKDMCLGMMQVVTAHKCAFWNRKKHIVTIPYEDNFSEDNIPKKSRPCQMNAELVIFCKKEIDNLLQKGLIKPSKSLWSCTAFYVNNAAKKERGYPDGMILDFFNDPVRVVKEIIMFEDMDDYYDAN
ncbi:uncharacterized protein LOC125877545 [Solanum stenotomum]|uniref:uncharacterized protein LOC125877545 n=1 Tax=Solanum stenotomum TaxID=172797 RepID=UPI0020D0523B|nr:uncharacterized protein LOC125877545 [Solanum stenotomum]